MFCVRAAFRACVCATLQPQSHTPQLIVGTHFYMSPEYVSNGQVSEKLDSYAFAIVLLELLTGKPPAAVAALNIEEPDVYQEMPQYVDGRAGAWPPAVVHRLAAVAERCVEFRPRPRAAVRDVVDELEELLAQEEH